MGILLPFALAALPLLGVIVALYLLKLRRPVAPVASLHLWETLTRDREANSLWQRLNVSMLLILQLAALLALILALARPWVTSAEPVGRNAIVVIDVSASMGANDATAIGQKSRLSAAKDRANSIIEALPQDGTLTLITTADHASLVVPPTSDKARLRAAVNALQVQATGTDLGDAMKLVSALTARQPNSDVWVLSDGAFAPVGATVDPIPATLHYQGFGSSDDNAGITALSLEEKSGNLQLFAQITNSRPFSVTRRLDLKLDDQPWTARTVELGPQATQELVVEDVPLQSRVVQAQLAEPDALDVDNTAWTVNRASAPANVLLVTDGNKFLELALSLLPTVNLYKVSYKDYKPEATLEGGAPDLTILDSTAPTETLKTLPGGNVLLLAPQQSTSLIQVSGVITEPAPSLAASGGSAKGTGDSSRDPLLKYVDLSGLHVAKAAKIEQPKWAHTVLGSDKGPLIVAGEENNRRAAVVAFDLHDTDLPVQTAFPLLIRNLVTYLLPPPAGGLPSNVAPGAPVSISPAGPNVNKIVIEDPNAKDWNFAISAQEPQAAFAATGQTGVYYVTQYAGTQIVEQEAFAVNLFSHDESMIAPNEHPGLPQTQDLVPAEGGSAAPVVARDFQREIWPLVAVFGLLVLLGEWAFAQRVVIRRAVLEWQTRRAARAAR